MKNSPYNENREDIEPKSLSEMFHERFPFVSHFIEVPILRKITLCYLAVVFCNIFLTAVYFCTHWDVQLIVKNGVFCIVMCMVFLMTNEALASMPLHFAAIDCRKKMWPFSEAGQEVFQQIQRDIRFLRQTRIIGIVLAILSSMICLPISGDIREVFCILFLIDDIDQKKWLRPLIIFTAVTKLYLAITLTNPLYMALVPVGDNTYGLMILREKIRSIEKIYGIKNKWYHKELKKVLEKNILAMFFLAVFLFPVFYFSVKMNMSNVTLFKSISIIILCLLFSYLLSNVGQRLKDESEELFRDLCNCPWFLWNKSNKMLYMMFLMHAKEPLGVSSLGWDLDNTILVRVARTTMTIFTTLQKLAS